jgi:hypothetical protein
MGREKADKPDRVSAFPTKRFFVEMLTRDISLEDAVLDLLDNCIDGVVRTKGASAVNREKQPYAGFHAHLSFDQDHFLISDNCGGISRELAEKSAFMLGRPKRGPKQKDVDADLPTVGVYGIGMKRAIFKMGRYSEVKSTTAHDSFRVTIPEKWFGDESDWELPISDVGKPGKGGTDIRIEKLDKAVSRRFAKTGDFQELFSKMVGQHYSLIIQKGFEVKVNKEKVTPSPLVFRTVQLDKNYKAGIAPYMFKGTVEGVEVSLKVGFYRPSVDEDELEHEGEAQSSYDEAGWTVTCNDRVVLYRDKTRLTGWGEANVPSYHNQFIAISGIVHFRSNDPLKLPVTTTKRGIDAGSDIYLQVKDRMRDGLKKFTAFTYRLKKDKNEKTKLFNDAKSVNEDVLNAMSTHIKWRADPKIKHSQVFVPNLPTIEKNDSLRTVRFSKAAEDISKLGVFLFENSNAEPGDVGERCFDRTLAEAKSK